MKESICNYCKDEFCVNADCPMRADYCPVPDTPGVCRYEERVEKDPLDPKKCLAAAFNDCGHEMRGSEVEEIFGSLVKIMDENGWAIMPKEDTNANKNKFGDINPPEINQVAFEPKKYVPGMIVSVEEIDNSNDWVFKRKIGDGRDGHENLIYVTRDNALIVSFIDGNNGMVKLNQSESIPVRFRPGQSVHFAEIDVSDDWVYTGATGDDNNRTVHYVTKDGKLAVSFRENATGIVTLNKAAEQSKYLHGQKLTIDEVSTSEDWKLKSFMSNPFDTTCTYINQERTMIIVFEHGKDHGVVQEFDEFEIGKRVHVGAIGASPKWKHVGEENGVVRYVTVDGKRYIAFVEGSDWGTVMLNQ